MTYHIYAFSKLGVHLTTEVLENLGYQIRFSSSPRLGEDKVGTFVTDVVDKTAVFIQLRQPDFNALNLRNAFRATTFINKYMNLNNQLS